MKKICELGLLVFIASFIFSCSLDEGPMEPSLEFINSYGLVIDETANNSNSHSIIRDDGALLIIKSNLLSFDTHLASGQRILLNYRISGSADRPDWSGKAHEITLYAIEEIETKTPISESALVDDALQNQYLGYDPVSVREAWFGGKYLNVILHTLRRKESNVEHKINVVYDDSEIRSDSAFITLRHNAFGDTPAENDDMEGFEDVLETISFDISSVLPEGQTSIVVRFRWTEYGNPPYLGFEKWGDAQFVMNYDCPIVGAK